MQEELRHKELSDLGQSYGQILFLGFNFSELSSRFLRKMKR